MFYWQNATCKFPPSLTPNCTFSNRTPHGENNISKFVVYTKVRRIFLSICQQICGNYCVFELTLGVDIDERMGNEPEINFLISIQYVLSIILPTSISIRFAALTHKDLTSLFCTNKTCKFLSKRMQ